MRSMRSEWASVLTAFAIPILLVVAFPYRSLSFRSMDFRDAGSRPMVAFVTLSAEQERKALSAAKAIAQHTSSAQIHVHANLSFGELPREIPQPVLDKVPLIDAPLPEPAPLEMPSYLPSLSAPPPHPIRMDEVAESGKLTFPRQEMLKID